MSKKAGLSKSQMRETIKRINRIDLSKSDFKTIKSIVGTMIPGVPIMIGPTKSHELFFRARKNPTKKLRNVSDACAPPPEYVTGFQRCNSPGNPMFYCSSRRITALLECDAQPSDTVYLSQWIGMRELPVNKIFFDEESPSFEQHLDEKDNMLHSYLDTLFTKRIHKDFSDDYKVTAAFSDYFTSDFKSKGKDYIMEDGRIGLRYPSVADIENSYNTAFPPHFALSRIDLLHVMEIVVTERHGDDITVSLKDTATKFDNGKIHWTGNMFSIPAPRDAKGGVAFRFSGEKWEVLTTEHLPVPHDIVANLLNELLKE